MGNHEFCEGCGESDFHRGKTCQEAYPESFAKEENARRQRRHEREQGSVLIGGFVKELKEKYNIEAIYDNYGITIYGFELVRAEKRKHEILNSNTSSSVTRQS